MHEVFIEGKQLQQAILESMIGACEFVVANIQGSQVDVMSHSSK
jgi:hypothetical protein